MTVPNSNRQSQPLQRGIALIMALLLLLLMSGLAVALIYKVNTEQNLQRTDSGNTMAYYGAEAGMEKLMADLSALYAQQAAPNWCDITGLTANPPSVSDVGVTYPVNGYLITVPPPLPVGCVTPPSRVQTISTGPNAGLLAWIVPLTLQVTADRPSGEEVSMIRQVEVAEIPVFQFGVFSQSDLSYFPGPVMDFWGRVQTNGNLFLAASGGLTFHAAIRAAGDVVRDQLANGQGTVAQARLANVNIPTATAGCDGAQPACRNLGPDTNQPADEGSSIGGPSPAYGGAGVPNPGWNALSQTTYKANILSGSTGATPLNLPFVQNGVNPIEIIRRPLAGESPSSALGQSRLYNQAQIRVLLSDNPLELPGGAGDAQNIRLANVKTNALAPDYSNGVPVPGAANTYFAEGTIGTIVAPGPGGETDWPNVPAAEATLTPPGAPAIPPAPPAPPTWNLLDGYLRVEIRKTDGTYQAVTREWLELGFARGLMAPTNAAPNPVHPIAILILQQQADRNGNGVLDPAVPPAPPNPGIPAELVIDPGTGSAITGAATRNNWYPINIYESREGELRENQRASATCNVGGIVNAVEIDVKNLRRWLKGTIGASGNLTEFTSQNGYVLYFSDRRGMEPNPKVGNIKNGEYGFEDVINPASAAGTPNGVLDAGEDVSGRGGLPDTWGAADLGLGFGGVTGNITTAVNCLTVARKNWVSGARHVVRLVDGAQGNLPTRRDNDSGGFTLAAENPAYIQGDYNASGGFGNPHAEAAVVADTVTLLSNNWNDLRSFQGPADVNQRPATTSYYRVAIASGKNMNFPFAGPSQDYGTDGGMHNFLRYLENWGGQNSNYLGSMVSLYYSMYATGIFKCCGTVYSPPNRNYVFDNDFLTLGNMPPGTPRLRDVVNLGFQRVF